MLGGTVVVGAAMRKKSGSSQSLLAARHVLGVVHGLVLGEVHVHAGHNLADHVGGQVLAVHGSRQSLCWSLFRAGLS